MIMQVSCFEFESGSKYPGLREHTQQRGGCSLREHGLGAVF